MFFQHPIFLCHPGVPSVSSDTTGDSAVQTWKLRHEVPQDWPHFSCHLQVPDVPMESISSQPTAG